VRDGDEWVISGQKVWSTFAHLARWGMLVARHDSSLPKHAGLTYFVVDMTAPGIEVRPLRQMTGEAEFNEVYLTEVRVPDGNRIGAVGEGWSVSLTTLMNERVAIGSNPLARGEGPIAGAVSTWRRRSDVSDSLRRDRLMRLWCEAEVLRLTGRRAARGAMSGTPGPAGSTTKLQWAELNRRIGEFCVDLMGAEGMLYPDGYGFSIPDQESSRHHSDQMRFLRARANSIEGGTSEIMRNILGERVLGLPGEPRVDRDLPWSQIPR
jgi:alkylation response protein AidB-like acyl-CoA dehydrogenase